MAPAAASPRRGRPPLTSRRELQLIALRLFSQNGFDETTIEQITAEAGVSQRTFFRYFSSKASVLWSDFDTEVNDIRAALARAPDDVPMMDAIRTAVVSANHYRAEDVPELRMRYNLIGTVPALQSSAAAHYDAWERAVSEFAAARLGMEPGSLYPLAIGRAVLAASRAAYDRWSSRADTALTVYLDAVLSALSGGFAPESLRLTFPELDRTQDSGHLCRFARPVFHGRHGVRKAPEAIQQASGLRQFRLAATKPVRPVPASAFCPSRYVCSGAGTRMNVTATRL
jgi:mycofactocin system transcriptional regulator